MIAFVTDSRSITRILAYLGEPTQAPHIAPATKQGIAAQATATKFRTPAP